MSTSSEVEESDRMPLELRRSSDQQGTKRFWRFDPTVSTGTLIQVTSLMVAFAVAYGTYREDQAKTRAEIEAVRVGAEVKIDALKTNAERDRSDSRGAVNEIRSDVKDVKAEVSQISKTLAVLEAQGRAKK